MNMLLSLDIIISTLNERVIPFILSLKKIDRINKVNFVVVCQAPAIEVRLKAIQISEDIDNLKLIFMDEKGLSKGRNLALQHSNADICLISDDDLEYDKNIYNIISRAFNETSADVITFNAFVPEREISLVKKRTHTKFSLAKIISFEIAFRKKSIDNLNLKFDEDFGLGAKFPTGEEYIFLVDCLNRKLKVIHEPTYIVNHPQISSGQVFTNENILARGAMIARVFTKSYHIINFLFAIKKRSYFNEKMSLLEFYNLISKGSKNYINFKS